MRKLALLIAFIGSTVGAFSQHRPFAFWDDPKGMILNQSRQLFEEIDRHLRTVPP